MGTITRSTKTGGGTNLNAGKVAVVEDVNTDMNTIVTEINGLLDDGNIETATIPGAKSLRFTEISSPSNPGTNDMLLFAKDLTARTRLYTRDSAGLEFPLGALVQEAFTNTEATTAVGTIVDLVTLTTSIPVTDGFMVFASLRRNAGAAFQCRVALKVNTSQVTSVTAAAAGWSSATAEVQQGFVVFIAGRQTTTYLRSISGFMAGAGASGVTNVVVSPSLVTDFPAATITSVIISANSGSASTTMGVQDVYCYRIQML